MAYRTQFHKICPLIAKEYGGDPGDWVKKTSSTFKAVDGQKISTHWVENVKTSQRVEFKSIVE